MKNFSVKELTAFLAMSRLRIEGRRRAVEFLASGKTAEETFVELDRAGLSPGPAPGEVLPEQELARCWEHGFSLLTIIDPAYPASLKEIPDPPLLLYVKGELQESDADAVAVVGTRHPSFYGRTQAKRFAGELAGKGLTVVSGLARGVDQAAHEAALEVPFGRTIAVLGCGLDVIYPRENEKLFRKIAERGAVLSEYALGTPPLAENFPRRNRIISGLSFGVLVVEAHSRSGSLITAHQALDQGREVFAIPGPVDQLTSRGTHQLLREGATLAENPDDIFGVLALLLNRKGASPTIPETRQPVIPSAGDGGSESQELDEKEPVPGPVVSGDGAEVIEDLLKEEGALSLDEILDFTGLEAARLPGLLLTLELTGKIKRTPEAKYALK